MPDGKPWKTGEFTSPSAVRIPTLVALNRPIIGEPPATLNPGTVDVGRAPQAVYSTKRYVRGHGGVSAMHQFVRRGLSYNHRKGSGYNHFKQERDTGGGWSANIEHLNTSTGHATGTSPADQPDRCILLRQNAAPTYTKGTCPSVSSPPPGAN